METDRQACRVCGRRAEGVFCVLAGEHLERLEREKRVQHYERGQIIFRAGDPAAAVYCIYEGRVKLYKLGKRTDEQVVRLLGPGDVLGYRALLAGEPYAATAEAIERTAVCLITQITLLSLIQSSPDLALGLLARMARDLRWSEEKLVSRTEDSVRARTARLLLWLAAGRTPTATIDVPLRRTEMAQMIGTSPETLSRTLHQLAGRGLLKLSRTHIEILNRAALESIVRRN